MDEEYQFSPGKQFVFAGFKILIVAISALTSFAFFITFLPSLIPSIITTEQGGSLITGLVGVILLDGACLVWLHLRGTAETGQQGTMAFAGAVIAFCGSALASVAYLALSASEVILDSQSTYTLQMVSLIGIITAVVANFALAILYEQNSIENQENAREIKRHHRIMNTEARHEKQLSGDMERLMREALKGRAPEMAQTGTEWYVEKIKDKERRRYGRPEPAPNGHRPVPAGAMEHEDDFPNDDEHGE
jgi:hypothetical protein